MAAQHLPFYSPLPSFCLIPVRTLDGLYPLLIAKQCCSANSRKPQWLTTINVYFAPVSAGFGDLGMSIAGFHLGLPRNLCSAAGFLAALWLLCRLIYKSGISRLSASPWPQPGQCGSAPLVLHPPAGQSKCVLLDQPQEHMGTCIGIRRANTPPAKPSHVVIPTV